MLTPSFNKYPSTILIPPWNTPSLYACARYQPLKGSFRSGFEGPIYKKLYSYDSTEYSGHVYQKSERYTNTEGVGTSCYTDEHIYTPSSDSFCTKGFPIINRYKESPRYLNLEIPEDLKNFNSTSLKSCCN